MPVFIWPLRIILCLNNSPDISLFISRRFLLFGVTAISRCFFCNLMMVDSLISNNVVASYLQQSL
uniref:Uncharacterized protein n=1 Tax=Triticum urartu TaxID=4572 RepID=A0A8R7TU84_TRIUA